MRKVLSKCMDCQKRKVKPAEQFMAELPKDRVTPTEPPFAFVGIDCFGPLEVKQGCSHRDLTLLECGFYTQCNEKIHQHTGLPD